jgi:sterol desaturase/sphingolipid hydroxylase (fatty acid hydroxylase superfamily)
MALTDLLLYATAAVFPLLLVIEHLMPARRQPELPAWRTLGIGFFVVFAAVSFFLPQALPPAWFEASLVPGAELGVLGGAVVGYLAVTLVGYAWHRAAHASPVLWRLFHQMHHAPRRLDVASAFIFHPSEMVFYTLMPLAVTTLVLGLDPVAAGIVGLLGVLNTVFQHANLATPRWLTWFMQRPEAHSIHHSVHAHNYSDFPLWDRLFGSYREGVGFRPGVGFAKAQSKRWGAMLLFRDVHAVDAGAPQEPTSAAAATAATLERGA